MFLQPTDSDEILKVIGSLNKNKALGPASIPTNILKDNVEVLAEPLSQIINMSFEQGKFPDLLKTAQVIPVHKKG